MLTLFSDMEKIVRLICMTCVLLWVKTRPCDLSASATTTLKLNLVAPSELFNDMIILVKPDIYILYWSYNLTDIKFEVHAKTNGWFGFGLSPTVDTVYSNADIVFGYINDDGTAHFSDGYLKDDSVPLLDVVQNWYPLYMSKTNGYTIFKFTRKLIICDTDLHEVDMNISLKSNNIIYSWGDIIDGNIADYGINSGIKRINLVKNLPYLPTCTLPPSQQVPLFTSKPNIRFSNHIELISNRLHFYWNISDRDFIGELHGRTNGWVAFGFHPEGNISYSDLIVGWIWNDRPYFFDCYMTDKKIYPDVKSDVSLLYFDETPDYTVFRFKRDVIKCDDDDIIINRGRQHIIYGFGDKDPRSIRDLADLTDHAPSIHTIDIDFYSKAHLIDKHDRNYDKLEFSISSILFENSEINFYCQSFEIPKNITRKRHIIKWEVKLPKLNSEKIKSITLYECVSSYKGQPKISPGECYANTEKLEYCYTPMIVWTSGSDHIVYFPEDTGYPIGGDSDYSYVVLEVYYHNPNTFEYGYIDKLSLELYTSKYLRPRELGVFMLGTESEPIGILIPPKVDHFPINSFCYNSCIKSKLEKVNNITVVMAFAQTNSAGVDVTTSLIRDDVDIGILHYSKNYGNIKNYVDLYPRIPITKDDSLVTKCTYSTLNRTSLTTGGVELKNELCNHMFYYYPRLSNFKYCGSFPTFDDQLKLFKSLKSVMTFNEPLSPMPSEDEKLGSLYSAYENLAKITNYPDYITTKLYHLYESSQYFSSCEDNALFRANDKLVVLGKKNLLIKDRCLLNKEIAVEGKIKTLMSDSSATSLYVYLNKTYFNILLLIIVNYMIKKIFA